MQKIPEWKQQKIIALNRQGLKRKIIQERLGVGRSTVLNILRKARAAKR